MKRCARWLGVILAGSIVAMGCGSSTSSSVGISITPTAVTVLVNGGVQFIPTETGSSNTINWSVNGVSGGNTTVGTITTGGFYTAPATVPANTTITVTAAISGTSASATATVTLDSGVRVVIAPSSFTVGTGEHFTLTATVTGVPTNASISGTCDNTTHTPVDCTAVTWSLTGAGTIDAATGLYTAPSSVGSGVAVVTATSVYDTTEQSTATVNIVAAATPAITSVSPGTGAIGAPFQDVVLTGTNLISTTEVFINGTEVSPANLITSVTTSLRVRIPASFLAVLPTSPSTTVPLTFTVAAQGGSQLGCTSNQAACQLLLSPVRPAIVGTSPDSVPQGSGALSFNVNGGFYGTVANPVVTADFNGQQQGATVNAANPSRQLTVTIAGSGNGGSFGTPGLFPVTVQSQFPGVPPATANLAVQPSYPTSAVTQLASLPVGTTPTAVAVDTATGIAVVANRDSNNVTLIDVSQPTPVVVAASLCTGVTGSSSTSCPASGPVSVAVDNLRDIALVANQTSQNVAVVDLSTDSVSAIIPNGPTSIAYPPAAVGIDPVSGRAIVAYRSESFASIVDLTQNPPVVTGIVDISNGPTPHIAISSRLDWALVTPGGLGSLSLVNLGLQTAVPITASGASRSSGTVTITTTAPHGLQAGQSVMITGVSDSSFDGIFQVLSVPSSTSFTYSQTGSDTSTSAGGGAVSYSDPVAAVATNLSVSGAAFNDQTEKAIIVDPTVGAGVPAAIFNALDQTSALVNGMPSTGSAAAAAFNPLANIAVTVDAVNNEAMIIDPTTTTGLPTVLKTFSVGTRPVDVAIDPGTDRAIIVNQGDNTTSIYSLGNIRSPQILQVSPERVTVGSTLTSGVGAAGSPTLSPQTVTIIGSGFTSGSVARLDGVSLATSLVSSRELTATVPTSMLTAPRRFALDVTDSGSVSNAAGFTVIQSVDVGTNTCSTPTPQGVAIDPDSNTAVVTDSGCNDVALINLATGTGDTVDVGKNPQGVAVLPQSNLAVVANQDDNTASIVDDVNATVEATVNTDAGPAGVAIDPVLGEAVVAASQANVVDVFPVSATPGTPTSVAVGPQPIPVAVDPTRHMAAVGNAAGGTVSIVNLSGTLSSPLTFPSVQLPTGIDFDPLTATFLAASSVQNQVLILDPDTQTATPVRVGINPTSLAYNFATGTLVTTNVASDTMTVVDLIDRRVRAILPVTPSSQFAVSIVPSTNMAVLADSAHGRVLFIPLPR